MESAVLGSHSEHSPNVLRRLEMAMRSTRRRAARQLFVTPTAFSVFVPQLAYGNTLCAEPPTVGQVTVRTLGPTTGPTAIFSEVSADAHCTNGLVSGGGISQTVGDPT